MAYQYEQPNYNQPYQPSAQGGGYSGYNPPSAYNYQQFQTPQNWFPNANEYNLGLYQQLHNFQNAGYFDPRGNQMLIEAGRMNAGNISGALQRQRGIASQTMGLPPAQRNSFNLESMLQGSGDYANLLNQALMEAWRRQADYAQSLGLQQAGLANNALQPQQRQPTFWDYLAGIGGQAAGAYAGSKGAGH